ncbi:MAG: hypothetical protein AB7L41_00280 [Flavobacteriaceae bacterium]
MGEIEIRDNSIWAKHLPSELRSRIIGLDAGQSIELEIDGIVGRWEKMQVGKDGRPVQGIKPVGAMGKIWKERFFPRRQHEIVPVREVMTADRYLASVAAILSEWESSADEEAYRDL